MTSMFIIKRQQTSRRPESAEPGRNVIWRFGKSQISRNFFFIFLKSHFFYNVNSFILEMVPSLLRLYWVIFTPNIMRDVVLVQEKKIIFVDHASFFSFFFMLKPLWKFFMKEGNLIVFFLFLRELQWSDNYLSLSNWNSHMYFWLSLKNFINIIQSSWCVDRCEFHQFSCLWLLFYFIKVFH